jgi:hypothetical protein
MSNYFVYYKLNDIIKIENTIHEDLKIILDNINIDDKNDDKEIDQTRKRLYGNFYRETKREK